MHNALWLSKMGNGVLRRGVRRYEVFSCVERGRAEGQAG